MRRAANNRRMTFALSEDQVLIRDAAANFLADASDSAAVRRAMDSAQGYDETLSLIHI